MDVIITTKDIKSYYNYIAYVRILKLENEKYIILSGDMEDIKKIQLKILDMKIIKYEMRNSLDAFH